MQKNEAELLPSVVEKVEWGSVEAEYEVLPRGANGNVTIPRPRDEVRSKLRSTEPRTLVYLAKSTGISILFRCSDRRRVVNDNGSTFTIRRPGADELRR